MEKADELLIDQEWQEHRAVMAEELEPGWETRYQPGSFGCHELLDRVSLLGDFVQEQVAGHPSCALRAEWHRLAMQAAEALRDLYQKVGAEHLARENS